MSREEATATLERLGAKVVQVRQQENVFVVVGGDAGSKLEKARKLGVEILTEHQFLAVIKKA